MRRQRSEVKKKELLDGASVGNFMMSKKPPYKQREEARGSGLLDYWPLTALICVSMLAAGALSYGLSAGLLFFMHYFMGIFLCIFALLKIFHPSAFADGFQMYDLIGKRTRIYAYIYPFIELALGLGYLSFIMPLAVYMATILIMTIGMIGVIDALRQGLDINCPCMGSVLDVPLSTVTLTEDAGMAIMAAAMLYMAFL
ncbi:MAG: hypothetical protein CMH27_02840 [Micavibrio sp.]|nr:hypothetical protein [Micavibrio sp.]|tara:strand:+ start:2570 stop:3166 length:597 start_codon:yes stop_codon:yes gene_type:complete